MPLLDANDRRRYEHELDLRDRGFVPLVAFDAITRHLHKTLPACQVRQVVPNKQPHGRIVWSHPGPSGVDPRALAPLALTRVADGLGPAPLDDPLTLGQAVRWLLTEDVERWLARPRHRALVGPCVLQSGRRWTCLVHPVLDPLLQDAADALGDRSMSSCRLRGTGIEPWSRARTQAYDPADLAASALDATRRLSRWHAEGARGGDAWELSLNNFAPEDLPRWHDAGFSTAEAAAWSGRESLTQSVRWRGMDVASYAPLSLPLAPVEGLPEKERGLHWYAQWQLSKRGRGGELVRCGVCGASDYNAPCRTCRDEGRAGLLNVEWGSYSGMSSVHRAYAKDDTGRVIPCGAENCQGSLALSAVDEGVRR